MSPSYLVYNSGNSLHPNYRDFPWERLLGGVLIKLKDRYSDEVVGTYCDPGIADTKSCYYVTSFSLHLSGGGTRWFNGSVVSSRRRLTPEYVARHAVAHEREIQSSLILKGYNLHFDGLVDIHKVGLEKLVSNSI